MFVDEITIYARAGDGGSGVVRWRHEKGKEFGGPCGGNGGRGGNIYALAVRDVHLLSKYRAKKELLAKHGKEGGSNSFHGADGDDLDILLPVGSVINDKRTGKKILLDKEGERVLLLHGGNGGRGNESFKSSRNRRPTQFTKGRPGEEGEFFIEVELIADIGLVGLPSAGKTSILNALTRAGGKVGAYPFTTLEPNLGECFGYIIADIPGLIEGAADGKGLGHKFLRHIRRTKILAHLVSLENEDLLKAYKTIRKELKQFDPKLLEKKEIVILTKADIIDDEKHLKKVVAQIKKKVSSVEVVSLYDDKAMKALRDLLLKEVAKK